ncbi:MAG TPA: hypothetical protein EYH49_04860 [Aquifex aeolicus]|nr:hypothetical protein [Aquifex aeolicus]
MRRYISKRLLYVLSLVFSCVILFYGMSFLMDTKEALTREYFRHKEFLFLLRSLPPLVKEPATEDGVIALFSEHRLKPERVYVSEGGVEVVLGEITWSSLPRLVRDLERRFEVVRFSAVDNTGKGVFKVRVVLR